MDKNEKIYGHIEGTLVRADILTSQDLADALMRWAVPLYQGEIGGLQIEETETSWAVILLTKEILEVRVINKKYNDSSRTFIFWKTLEQAERFADRTRDTQLRYPGDACRNITQSDRRLYYEALEIAIDAGLWDKLDEVHNVYRTLRGDR